MSSRRAPSLPPHAWTGLALCLVSLASVSLGAALVAPLGAQASTAARAPQGARAARLLPRGTVLTADDVMVLGDSLPPTLPIGWVTRRVVQQGEALRPPAIGRTPVVNSGGRVTIRAGNARLGISRFGIALADGAPGDTIPVRVDRASTIAVIVRDSTTVVPTSSVRP